MKGNFKRKLNIQIQKEKSLINYFILKNQRKYTLLKVTKERTSQNHNVDYQFQLFSEKY